MSTGNPYPIFDLTNAQELEVINDGHHQSDAPSVVKPYPQSQAGPSSGIGRAVGPIRSTDIPAMKSSSAPYTRQRPRSTKPRIGQVQPPARNFPSYHTMSAAEEWNSSIVESGLSTDVGQMGAAVANSAVPSSRSPAPALIAKTDMVESWMYTYPPVPEDRTENRRPEPHLGTQPTAFPSDVAAGRSQNAAPPAYPTFATFTEPPTAASSSSSSSVWPLSEQEPPQPQLPASSQAQWPLTSHCAQHTAVAAYQAGPTTPAPSPVQRAYSRLEASSQHYQNCAVYSCTMQHWNGKVRHQVAAVVGNYEGIKSPIRKLEESINWDLLVRYPTASACVHRALNWRPAQEIHLRSLVSASVVDANGHDLTKLIPNFNKIPGSLQLLVMMGGEQFYHELRKQVKVRWKVLSVAIGNALQLCDLVICNEFWKQLETEKEVIELWRQDFYVDLFDMKNMNRRKI